MNEHFTTHWEYIHEFAGDFGEDIFKTAKELNISFIEALALYEFLLNLSATDLEELYRIRASKHEL